MAKSFSFGGEHFEYLTISQIEVINNPWTTGHVEENFTLFYQRLPRHTANSCEIPIILRNNAFINET